MGSVCLIAADAFAACRPSRRSSGDTIAAQSVARSAMALAPDSAAAPKASRHRSFCRTAAAITGDYRIGLAAIDTPTPPARGARRCPAARTLTCRRRADSVAARSRGSSRTTAAATSRGRPILVGRAIALIDYRRRVFRAVERDRSRTMRTCDADYSERLR